MMHSILGDSIICASAVAYYGPFPQKYREIANELVKGWLSTANIEIDN
jgi:hypothetical protein